MGSAVAWIVRMVAPSVLPIVLSGLVTMFTTNTLHNIKNRWENRQIKRAAYKEGYDDAKAKCKNGKIDERRRWLPWLRAEPEPAWFRALDFGIPFEPLPEVGVDEQPIDEE